MLESERNFGSLAHGRRRRLGLGRGDANRRFGWSHLPVWLEAVGAVLTLVSFWGWVTVLRANSFAATSIRLQPERGQTVISSGPYAWVRHPMYAYALIFMAGVPLLPVMVSAWVNGEPVAPAKVATM